MQKRPLVVGPKNDRPNSGGYLCGGSKLQELTLSDVSMSDVALSGLETFGFASSGGRADSSLARDVPDRDRAGERSLNVTILKGLRNSYEIVKKGRNV